MNNWGYLMLVFFYLVGVFLGIKDRDYIYLILFHVSFPLGFVIGHLLWKYDPLKVKGGDQ